MPVFNNQLFENTPDGRQKISPNPLAQVGAILDVAISIPQALIELYQKEHKPIPSPITGIGLIDTGASRSCVHAPIMKQLGINPINVVTSGTANGQALHGLFPAHFNFLAAKIEIDFASVVGVNLTGQDINGNQIIALIGRDVLAMGIFVYNGSTGSFSLAI